MWTWCTFGVSLPPHAKVHGAAARHGDVAPHHMVLLSARLRLAILPMTLFHMRLITQMWLLPLRSNTFRPKASKLEETVPTTTAAATAAWRRTLLSAMAGCPSMPRLHWRRSSGLHFRCALATEHELAQGGAEAAVARPLCLRTQGCITIMGKTLSVASRFCTGWSSVQLVQASIAVGIVR